MTENIIIYLIVMMNSVWINTKHWEDLHWEFKKLAVLSPLLIPNHFTHTHMHTHINSMFLLWVLADGIDWNKAQRSTKEGL